jgi:hypothetical protein
MRIIVLAPILISQTTIACLCNNEVALYAGAKAIEAKYPEYKITRDEYEAVELDKKWMVLRKKHVYKENPREYPRVFISKDSCKIDKVLWSK